MSKKGLIRSSGLIAAATAASRVLGFVRDIVIANFFGTSIGAQAFVVAFRIPNSLRDLVGEGAMNSAIVPVLTDYKSRKGEEEFLRITRVFFNISLLVLSVLTVLGIIFSPLIVRLIAPGFLAEPEKFELTVTLNRVIFPYLILIGLTAYSMGVLNSLKHFAAPAFGPCLMNIALITAAVWLCPRFGVMALVAGVLAGGVMQLIPNMIVMYRLGITFRFGDGLRHAAVKRVGKLLLPRALGSAVYQVNIFVDTILASLAWIVGPGGVAALYFANRLIQFPLAIFGVAVAQAALPKMSEEFAAKDIERLKDTISFSLRLVFFIMLPSGVALAVLGGPIVRILFQRGEFTAYSSLITGQALFFYSFGLVAYGGIKLLVAAFFSMHDTVTPVKTAFMAVAANIILSVILMWPMKLGGLALATSISTSFNLVNLFMCLRRRIGDFGTRMIVDSFLRVLLASIVMGVVLKVFMIRMPPFGLKELSAAITLGITAFAVSCYLFEVKEFKDSLAWILKRR